MVTGERLPKQGAKELKIMTGEAVVSGVFDRVRQMYCGLHGHDSMLSFEQDRMFLKCTSCGHESPGWDLNEVPPTVSEATPRQAIIRTQLVGARRVA